MFIFYKKVHNCLLFYNYLCLRRCERRRCDCLNAWLHMEHTYGASPVCILVCTFRLPFLWNCLPHTSQACFRSPVCINICLLCSAFLLNDLLQVKHLCGAFESCILRWNFNVDARLNDAPHTEHRWSLPKRITLIIYAKAFDE